MAFIRRPCCATMKMMLALCAESASPRGAPNQELYRLPLNVGLLGLETSTMVRRLWKYALTHTYVDEGATTSQAPLR